MRLRRSGQRLMMTCKREGRCKLQLMLPDLFDQKPGVQLTRGALQQSHVANSGNLTCSPNPCLSAHKYQKDLKLSA